MISAFWSDIEIIRFHVRGKHCSMFPVRKSSMERSQLVERKKKEPCVNPRSLDFSTTAQIYWERFLAFYWQVFVTTENVFLGFRKKCAGDFRRSNAVTLNNCMTIKPSTETFARGIAATTIYLGFVFFFIRNVFICFRVNYADLSRIFMDWHYCHVSMDVDSRRTTRNTYLCDLQ